VTSLPGHSIWPAPTHRAEEPDRSAKGAATECRPYKVAYLCETFGSGGRGVAACCFDGSLAVFRSRFNFFLAHVAAAE
jgi:hypothetical protein